jgi:histone H2A
LKSNNQIPSFMIMLNLTCLKKSNFIVKVRHKHMEELDRRQVRRQKQNLITANFSTYIYKVLKNTHTGVGLSGDGLTTVNNLTLVILRRIITNLNLLMQAEPGRKTISTEHVSMAAKLALPAYFSDMATAFATDAVNSYEASHDDDSSTEDRKAQARSLRAGLLFPTTRCESLMMEACIAPRKSGTAAVFLAAVLEFIVTEILREAGDTTLASRKVRITPRHIKLTVLASENFTELFHGVVLAGGVSLGVNEALLPASKRATTKVTKVKSVKGTKAKGTKATTKATKANSAKGKGKGKGKGTKAAKTTKANSAKGTKGK